MPPLLDRVRNRLSGYQSVVDPHEWRLPSPSSYSTPKSSGKQTVVPNPRIFRNAFIPAAKPACGGSSTSTSTSTNVEASLIYPDISHAAVHLALLECFRNLRLSASALDVELHKPPAYEEKEKEEPGAARDHGPQRLPESERWDLLVDLATTRFGAWWANIGQVLHHATAYAHHAGDAAAVQLTGDYLPPLDVLLVWYAVLLDGEGGEDAQHHGGGARGPGDLDLCFPWPAIRDLMDAETMTLELPRAARTLFRTLSGQDPDVLTYLRAPPAYTETRDLPFATGAQLARLVRAHERFLDDAHELLWVRAPALAGSLRRAGRAYLEAQLGGAIGGGDGDGDGRLSFGVELVWRTHRLYPAQYRVFREGLAEMAGAGVGAGTETDDVKGGGGSSDLLSPPSSDPGGRRRTAGPPVCECWTCERIRDDLPLFTHSPPPAPTDPVPSGPSSSSSSSSSSPGSLVSALAPEQLCSIQDDVGFHQAVEEARRRGSTLPTRPPTAAEREAERVERERRKEAGVMPGLYEYFEVLPDGRRRIRKKSPGYSWGLPMNV